MEERDNKGNDVRKYKYDDDEDEEEDEDDDDDDDFDASKYDLSASDDVSIQMKKFF